jgi:hypothetical protein
MPTRLGVAVTLPLPILHAEPATVRVLRQAPPSIDALASSPGGRSMVRPRGESVPVSANLRSSPRFAVAPADVPALWSRLICALREAYAVGAVNPRNAITATAIESRRDIA